MVHPLIAKEKKSTCVGKTTNGNILLNLLPLQLRIENTKHVRSSKDRS